MITNDVKYDGNYDSHELPIIITSDLKYMAEFGLSPELPSIRLAIRKSGHYELLDFSGNILWQGNVELMEESGSYEAEPVSLFRGDALADATPDDSYLASHHSIEIRFYYHAECVEMRVVMMPPQN